MPSVVLDHDVERKPDRRTGEGRESKLLVVGTCRRELGSSEEETARILLLDREQQVVTVAPVAEARAFLEAQWPEQAPIIPEEQEAVEREVTRLLEEMRNRPIDWDAVARQQREQSTRVAVMMAFPDQQVPPSQGQTP